MFIKKYCIIFTLRLRKNGKTMEVSLQGVALRCDQLKSMPEPGRRDEFYDHLEEVATMSLVRQRMGALEELLRVAEGWLKYGRIDVHYELLEINSLPRGVRAGYTLKLAVHLRQTPGSGIFPEERLRVQEDALALAYAIGGRKLRQAYEHDIAASDLSRDMAEFDDRPLHLR
jgi:hypothetical protein